MPEARLEKIPLSPTKMRSLPPQQRYVFALLGHIFNELMVLQKFATITRPQKDARWFESDAAVGMMIQTLKMIVGKAHEAMGALTKKTVTEVLERDYFPLVPGLQEHWQKTLKHHQSLDWLGKIRNSGAFHYMSEGQWTPHLTDELCEGAYVINGRAYGGTWFHWHDAVAALPMMKKVNSEQPFAGLGAMLDEIIQLVGDISETLAWALQTFISKNLLEDQAEHIEEVFDAPELDSYHLPYYFSDESEHQPTVSQAG